MAARYRDVYIAQWKTMMKVGLYQANYRNIDPGWMQVPPLSLGYLAAYAEKYVGGIEFIIDHRLDRIIESKPDIVGITYVTHSVRHAVKNAREIKDTLGCPVIAGGPHVSTLPTVLEEPFDIGVIGEGEETFAELMELYQAEDGFAPASLAKIKGLSYRDADGVLQRTEPRPFIQDLDRVPYPDRDRMFAKWTDPQEEWQIMTSRGCPYDCSFCSVIVQWGQVYRCHSEEYVVGEIELIRRKYRPKTINMFDDLFTVQRKRVLRIMEMIRERDLHKGVEFTCFVRSNLIDDELMEVFAKTNFKVLNVGFESGSDRVMQIFNKQSASQENHLRTVELARKYGLLFNSCFILGAPGETREDIMQSFEFVRKHSDVFYKIIFTPLMVFPGTQIWEDARRIGVSETNMDGVALEERDFDDGMDFLRNRWPYLNEERIPREEMINYLRLGDLFSQIVCGDNERMRELQSAEWIARNVPIGEIVKEKARRHLGGNC